METYHLSDSEYRFMQVVWDAERWGPGSWWPFAGRSWGGKSPPLIPC